MPLTTLDLAPALVVIDLQNGIVSGAVAHAVPHAADLAKAFRDQALPVVLVNVTGRAPGRTDAGGHGGAGTPPATTATTSSSPRTRWPTPTRLPPAQPRARLP
jgi:nicotinamidase-related amidase